MSTATTAAPTEGQLIDAMERIGGGFASALARAWRRADLDNRARLRREFGDLLQSYAWAVE